MADDTAGNDGAVSGTAKPSSSGTAKNRAIPIVDGRCITRTLQRVQNMSPEALTKVRAQSEALVGRVLDVYEAEVGTGEVGHGGSAIAGPQRMDGLGPTGLLYGRIQSGKTVAMITFTALAIDNGFRIVIVLTTNFTELVKQTKDRFDDLGRVLVRASTDRDEWKKESEIEHLRKTVPERGLVMICAKHAGHLRNVLELLDKIDGANYPALILDDEADQASLDNNARRRSRSKEPDEVQATTIHRSIKEIREYLRHHLFLQVTATPYALLLQRTSSPLRPKFTFLLEPGTGYTGGEDFFSRQHITEAGVDGKPPLVFVGENESKEIEAGPSRAPRGLENAIAYFLVAAAAQALDEPKVLSWSQNFLCHTSHKKAEHDKLHDLIVQFTSMLAEELDPLRGRAEILMQWAYAELCKTLEAPPPLGEIIEDVVDRLPRRKVRIVNSEGKSGEEVRGAPNFIIGGNIVGRGLTIPNLLVTYYVRKPKVSQMDTMLQHARMFGYRHKLMPYTRVFLPRTLALRFWGIHEAEDELRAILPDIDALDQIPVQVIGELRATRYGVLDTASIVTIRSGKHLYPTFPELSRTTERRVLGLAKELWEGWDETTVQKDDVPVSGVCKLIEALAPPEWDSSALGVILESMARDDTIRAVYRPMDRGARRDAEAPGSAHLATGALSGEELRSARALSVPTFFLFRQTVTRPIWEDVRFFYPTLVFPASMPNLVYNNSEPD